MNTSNKFFFAAVLLMTVSCKKESNNIHSGSLINTDMKSVSATDVAAAKYTAVLIGTQKWMTANLNVNRYRNGDRIPQVKDPIKWKTLTTGAWCWYNNDSANYAVTYGKLYNWYAVHDARGLAPNGWHIPAYDEIVVLYNLLGGYQLAGGPLKETGTVHWAAPNVAATNSTGFTALPGGYQLASGSFTGINTLGLWWSASENSSSSAWDFYIYNNYGTFSISPGVKQAGLSVRCIKD
ncbi:MAG TPA: fibrobacter succinogenes major paralogous domain-containing protein [Panacibacter sp.]|nr:fibrobacter succinogenes major paralogous domain-containing protein [Panacibacter sp.]